MSNPAAAKADTLSEKAKGKKVAKTEPGVAPRPLSKGVGRMTVDRKHIVIEEQPRLLKVATDANIFNKAWKRYESNPTLQSDNSQAWKKEARDTWMPKYVKVFDATPASKQVRQKPVTEQRVFGISGHPREVPEDGDETLEDAYLYRMAREPLIRRDEASPNKTVQPHVPYSDKDKRQMEAKIRENPDWFWNWVKKDVAYKDFGIPEDPAVLPVFLRNTTPMQTDASLEDALKCCSVGMDEAGSSGVNTLPMVQAVPAEPAEPAGSDDPTPAASTKAEVLADVTRELEEILKSYSTLNGNRGRNKYNLRQHLDAGSNSEFPVWLRRYSHFEGYTDMQLLYAKIQSVLETFNNYIRTTLKQEFESSRRNMWELYGKNRVAKYIHEKVLQKPSNEEEVSTLADMLSGFYENTKTAMNGRAYGLVNEEDWTNTKSQYLVATRQELEDGDLAEIVLQMVAEGGLPYDICNEDPPVYLDNEGTRTYGYYWHTEQDGDARSSAKTEDLKRGQAKVERALTPERARNHWRLLRHLYAVYDATTQPQSVFPDVTEKTTKILDAALFTKQTKDCDLPGNWPHLLHSGAEHMRLAFPEEFAKQIQSEETVVGVDISKWLGPLGVHLGNAKYYRHLHEAIIFFGAKPSYWEFLFRGGRPGTDHFAATGSSSQVDHRKRKLSGSALNTREMEREEQLASVCRAIDFWRLYTEEPQFYTAKDWFSYLEEVEAQPQPDYTDFVVLQKLGFAETQFEANPEHWHFHRAALGDKHSVTYFARRVKGSPAHYLLCVLYDQHVHYCMYFAIVSKQEYIPATENDRVGSESVRNAHDHGFQKLAYERLDAMFEDLPEDQAQAVEKAAKDVGQPTEEEEVNLEELEDESKKTRFDDFLEELLGPDNKAA